MLAYILAIPIKAETNQRAHKEIFMFQQYIGRSVGMPSLYLALITTYFMKLFKVTTSLVVNGYTHHPL